MPVDHEVSTHRRGWGVAPEAPTHLPAEELDISLSQSSSRSRSRSSSRSKPTSKKVAPPNVTLVSVAEAAIAQGPQAVQAALAAAHAQGPQVFAALQAALQQVIEQLQAQQAAGSAPAPLPPPPVVMPKSSAPQMAAPIAHAPAQIGDATAFDPLAVPLPPELAPPVYAWLRRLALQADLAAADRLLRDAFAELTSSLSVVVIYASPDGFYTLGPDGELPKDQQPIVAVGQARRALVGPHSALLPIATATETIGVVQLVRNARQPAYAPQDHLTMAALAREGAGVMHHLVVEHLQRKSELARDKGSLYRPEALENHRKKGQEGVLAELSPKWTRRAYPFLCVTMLVAIAFAIFIKVPTYTTGKAVIVYPGTIVTAPAVGTLDGVVVEAHSHVKKGDVLFKIKSEKEEADLKQAISEYENTQNAYMFDPNDEQQKRANLTAAAQKRRAEAAIEQKTVRAPCDGIVSDIDMHQNKPLQFGDQVMKILDENALPEVWSFIPGSDLPRVHINMPVQVELDGYTKSREEATIYSIGHDVVGSVSARSMLDQKVADSLGIPQDGSFAVIKARLPATKFKTEHHVYSFADGMKGKAEIRLEAKRFIVTLLPAFEKYLD